MRNLELSAYGVEEMTRAENQTIQGGSAVLFQFVVSLALATAEAHYAPFYALHDSLCERFG